MRKDITIAIDGPVAAGKGTIAKLLAEKLHGFHLYSGGMYRCVALYCLEHNINMKDNSAVIASLSHMTFGLEGDKVFLNGKDVTEAIKERPVVVATPTGAAIAEVRKELVKRQQAIAHEKAAQGYIVIAEGRDAATKIIPDAFLKVYITATPEVRAKRRMAQMATLGENHSFEEILKDTIQRDKEDTERKADPLVKDPEQHGYFVVDDSTMTEEQTVEMIKQELERKLHDSH